MVGVNLDKLFTDGKYQELIQQIQQKSTDNQTHQEQLYLLQSYRELNHYTTMREILPKLKRKYSQSPDKLLPVLIEELYMEYRSVNYERTHEIEQYILECIQKIEETTSDELVLTKYGKEISLFRYIQGNIAWRQEKLDIALKYFNISRNIAIEHDLIEAQIRVFNAIGNIHRMHNNLDEAIKNYKLCLANAIEHDFQKFIIYSYTNLGDLHRLRGLLSTAEEYLLKARNLQKEIGSTEALGVITTNLGIVYYQYGQISTAKSLMKEALTYFGELDNSIYSFETLYYLILICKHRRNTKQMKNYYKKLISLDWDYPELLRVTQNLVELLLDENHRHIDYYSNYFTSNEFLSVFKEANVTTEFRIISIMRLCEVLIEGFQSNPEPKRIQLVDLILDKIDQYSLKYNYIWLKLETYYLRGRFCEYRCQYRRAKLYYMRAIALAQQFSFHYRQNRIKQMLYQMVINQPITKVGVEFDVTPLLERLETEYKMITGTHQQLFHKKTTGGDITEFALLLEPLPLGIMKYLYTQPSILSDELLDEFELEGDRLNQVLVQLQDEELITMSSGTQSVLEPHRVSITSRGIVKFEDFMLFITWESYDSSSDF